MAESQVKEERIEIDGAEELEAKLQELEEAQKVNDIAADVPDEIEIDGKTFKLHKFTIARITKLDRIVLQLGIVARRIEKVREQLAEAEEDEEIDRLLKQFEEESLKREELLIEYLYHILNVDEEHEVASREWIREHVDVTPNGDGRKIVEIYKQRCNVIPFYMDVLSSRQFL